MTAATLRINLAVKPVIRALGFNVHGRRAAERFRMRGLWSFHLYRWHGALAFGGRQYPIQPGCASLAPPDTLLTWHFPPTDAAHCFVHFATGSPGRGAARFPVMQDLGEQFAAVWQECEELIALQPQHPLRAEIRFWDLLLRLAEPTLARPAPPEPAVPFPLKTVLAILDNERDRAHSVTGLARRVGVSRNHLTRLFHQSFQTTASAYLQTQRLTQARQLLAGTHLSIKLIAAEIGLPDLQRFNKFFRKHTGRSPRAYRAALAQSTPSAPADAVTRAR